MAPLHSLGYDKKNEMQYDSLVMWYHLHQNQHHVMPMASSMTPSHPLGQENWNEVQHDSFGHVAP